MTAKGQPHGEVAINSRLVGDVVGVVVVDDGNFASRIFEKTRTT